MRHTAVPDRDNPRDNYECSACGEPWPCSAFRAASPTRPVAPVDHTKPHYCEHDGGDALVPPPNRLFYVGARYSTDTLATRDCPVIAAGGDLTHQQHSHEFMTGNASSLVIPCIGPGCPHCWA